MNNGNHTLIIEDNPGDLMLLQDQLETAGWPVNNSQNEGNLTDAIKSLKTTKPILVFLDLNLPDSNGLETFLTIQSIAPDIPIIILSGTNDTSLSIQAVQSGAQDFLVKGEFEEKLLLKTILYSIERKKIQLNLEETNKRFTYVSKATNEPLWDWDIRSNEIFWNDKVKIFGYHDAVLKNESWRMSNIHSEDRDRIISKLNEILKSNEEKWSGEYRFRCADGTYKYIYDRGYILRDKDNQPYRVIGTMQDVTEQISLRKKLEKEKELQYNAVLKATIEGQEKERNEIGKEMHDNINQILVAASMHLSLVKPGDEITTLKLVKESKDLILGAVKEIRDLTHAMVSSQIKDIGLLLSIEDLIERISLLYKFSIEFKHNITDNFIPSGISLNVFRIIQEQLNNIIKHAGAKNVFISLNKQSGNLLLQIIDDGKGADLTKKERGIGLSNIRNRVTAYSGKTTFESSPENGFKVSIEFPFI